MLRIRTYVIFLLSSGPSVADVYYTQPLLDALAANFSISHATISGVVTTQVGCALVLVLLVPLGDLLKRRQLMLVRVLLQTIVLVFVGLAWSPAMVLRSMLLTGAPGTAMTQGLIALCCQRRI